MLRAGLGADVVVVPRVVTLPPGRTAAIKAGFWQPVGV